MWRISANVPQAPRRRLLELLSAVDLRLVLSGHTHQYLDRRIGPVHHAWVPSTAYVFPDGMQERFGEKATGLCVLEVMGDAHRLDLVAPAGMARYDLTEQPFYRAETPGDASAGVQGWPPNPYFLR